MEIEASLNSEPAIALAPPVLIGELALLTQTERPVSVVARSPCTVLRISRDLFTRVLKEHPRSAAQVKNLVESRLMNFSKELSEIGSRKFLDTTASPSPI